MENILKPLEITPEKLIDVAKNGELELLPPPGKGFAWSIISANGTLCATLVPIN